MNDRSSLREGFLATEKVSADLEARYEARLKTILERPLKRHERVAWTLAGVGSVCMAVFFTITSLRLPSGFPVVGRLVFGGGIVFCLGWLVLSVKILRRGTARFKWDSNAATGLLWLFLVLMMTGDLLLGNSMPDVARGTQLILTGLVFVVMFGHQLPLNRINQAEMNVREELLRLQLQIAELAKRLPQESSVDRGATGM